MPMPQPGTAAGHPAAVSNSSMEMARRMRTSRTALERLLDPDNPAVTLSTLQKAARAVGRELRLDLV